MEYVFLYSREVMMNTPASYESPPAHVVLDLVLAAADFQHLVFLDKAWTETAESGALNDDRDCEALFILGNKVYDQIGIAERHAHNMRRFFDLYGAWADATLRDKFASDFFAGAQKGTILKILDVKNDGYAECGVALSNKLVERLPMERGELQKKISNFRGKGPVLADMSGSTTCGVLAAATMLGLLGCPKTGVGCLMAAGAGAILIAECS